MSKLGKELRAIGLINNYDLLRRFGQAGDVAIEYYRRPEGRLGYGDFDHTLVWSPFRHKALKEDDMRQPHKKFIGNRAESFQLAVNWAMAEFGHDYVVSPHGGRIPEHIRHKAVMAVKKAAG